MENENEVKINKPEMEKLKIEQVEIKSEPIEIVDSKEVVLTPDEKQLLKNIDVLNGLESYKFEPEAQQKLIEVEQLKRSEQLAFFDVLVKGKFLPQHIGTAETAFSIYEMGKELGFKPMQSFHYIIPILGKLSLSAKAQGALLRKNNIYYKCTKYFKFIYNIDGKITESDFPLYRKGGEEHNKYFITNLTEIYFKRAVTFNGQVEIIEQTVTYSMLDAHVAGVVKPDSNYVKFPADMCYSRCLTRGINMIGSDITTGLTSISELL